MNGKVAAVIGSTGLIGGELLRLLQNDDYFSSIRVLVRRPVTFESDKVQMRLLSFSDLEAFKMAIDGSDAVFCAVGTTQKKVKGDKEAYRKVDYEIPLNAARFCEETGVQKFLLVSSVGARSSSKYFYLKLKGEVEEAVTKKNIKSIHIFRPSMLLGERKEFRPGEKIGQLLMKPISFLLPSRYKPVQAKHVAMAMLASAKTDLLGVHIYEYGDMKKLIKS